MASWHAKPSGNYPVGSTENIENAQMIASWCRSQGWQDGAIIGILGNIMGESGMNPWRYQSDSLSGAGYGLFQYTPKSGYLDAGGYGNGYPNFAPNRSTSSITTGAEPTDGICQLEAITRSGKYSTSGNIYQGGTRLGTYQSFGYSDNPSTLADYGQITDARQATDAWLCFFEAPSLSNLLSSRDTRYNLGVQIWESMGGVIPPSPTPTGSDSNSKWWLIKKKKGVLLYANKSGFYI